jgi:transcriptional regulator with XRE-family HTH domain
MTLQEEPMAFVGRRIADRRHELRLSMKALAQRVGISSSHLSRVECGERTVRIGTVCRIADALKCPTFYFWMTRREWTRWLELTS